MQKKTAIWLASTGCVVVGVGAWWLLRGPGEVPYRTAAVERGDISVTVSATGSPNAVVTVQVGSQVSGIIQSLMADFNTKVKKGQLIAQIDPAPFQAKVNEGRANLDSALANSANGEASVQQALASLEAAKSSLAAGRANVAKTAATSADAEAKVNRTAILTKEGISAKVELETAETTHQTTIADYNASMAQSKALEDAVKVSQAQLTVARGVLTASQAQVRQVTAALQLTQIDLANTSIKAPVDGVVVSRNVDVGQTVAASLSAPVLFLIAQDLTNMQVDTNVSEADVGRVQVGQAGTFTVDAYPGRTFRGTVTSIRKAPINVQNVITYDAVLGVSNADLKLFPGMTANVRILVSERANVMRVPNAALRFRPASAAPVANSGGKKKGAATAEKAVWILDAKGVAQRVAVTTGESDGTFTEVTGGSLKESDQVIVGMVAPTVTAPSSSSKSGRGPGF